MALKHATSPADLRSLFEEKVRRGLFDPVARHLRSDLVEDRLQEGIGQVYEMFIRYATEKGVILPDAILVHAVRLRAVDLDRRLVRADGTQPKRCAMDERNYHEGRVEVLRLDRFVGLDEDSGGSGEGDRALAFGFAEATNQNPVGHILSAIDLSDWLSKLDERDQQMLAARAAGYTLGEVAADLGVSVSTVFSRCKRLGEELSRVSGAGQGCAERTV